MGALKVETPELAEVKRMFTLPEVRGQRVGSALLAAIEALAREKGIAVLMLETGEGEGFVPAHRVYTKGGFTRCGAFLDYPRQRAIRPFSRSGCADGAVAIIARPL